MTKKAPKKKATRSPLPTVDTRLLRLESLVDRLLRDARKNEEFITQIGAKVDAASWPKPLECDDGEISNFVEATERRLAKLELRPCLTEEAAEQWRKIIDEVKGQIATLWKKMPIGGDPRTCTEYLDWQAEHMKLAARLDSLFDSFQAVCKTGDAQYCALTERCNEMGKKLESLSEYRANYSERIQWLELQVNMLCLHKPGPLRRFFRWIFK